LSTVAGIGIQRLVVVEIVQAREQAGLTQEEVAKKLHTKKTAISRLEQHATDVRLSTLSVRRCRD